MRDSRVQHHTESDTDSNRFGQPLGESDTDSIAGISEQGDGVEVIDATPAEVPSHSFRGRLNIRTLLPALTE